MSNEKNSEYLEIPDIRTLNILYTNDLKGEAEQMAYLATVVKQQKAQGEYTLLLDSGNWARGTLLSDSFKGMPMVEIFSAMEYDAIGIGEGEISYGSKNLYMLEEKAEFPFVCCNLTEEGTGFAPYFVKKFITVQRGPFSIAITGIANNKALAGSGFQVEDPFTLLPGVLKEIQDVRPDLVILLSRMGLEKDKALARAFPQINAIIGGGDGINLENPAVAGQTYICQAGERGKFLGSLSMDLEATLRITSTEE